MSSQFQIPAWVMENFPNAFANPNQGIRSTLSDAMHFLERREPRALYLLDGPTFPVGDGGSWLKSKILGALASSSKGVVAIAPQLGVDLESQYQEIGVPVIWLDANEYYGPALNVLLSNGAKWVFTDSLETAARTRHLGRSSRRAVLMMDDYASTGGRECIGHRNTSRTRLVQQVLDSSSLSIWRSRQDTASYPRSVERSLIVDGIEHSQEVETSSDGPLAMLANFMYPPNRTAAKHLLGLDWGTRRLKLIGRIDRSMREDAERLGHHCTGLVPNPREELNGCSAGIDPVLDGSGLSTKLGTYISVGLPALATRVAVRGMSEGLVRHLTVVDRPAQFPPQIETWDYSQIRSQAKQGRLFARDNLDLAKQLKQLMAVISEAQDLCG